MDKRIHKVFASREMIHIRKAVQLFRLIEQSIDSLDTEENPRALKVLTSIKMKRVNISPFSSDWRSSVDPTLSPPGMSHRLRVIHFDSPFETIKKWLNVNLLVLTDNTGDSFCDQAFHSVEIKTQNESGVSVKFGPDPFSCTLSVTSGQSSKGGEYSELTIVNLAIDTPINLLLEKFTTSKQPTNLKEYTDRHLYSDLFNAEFQVEKYRNTIYYLMDYLSFLTHQRFKIDQCDNFTYPTYTEFVNLLDSTI